MEREQVVPPKRLGGWLEKQSDWTMSWRRRLFHLEDMTISYRLDEQSPDKDCAQIECLERNAGHENAFRIWTERGACWVLRAPTCSDHKLWVDTIAQALDAKDPIERSRKRTQGSDSSNVVPVSTEEGVEDAATIVESSSAPRAIRRTLLDGVLSSEVDKLSSWTRSWRRRYIVLDGLNFYYSETPGGSCKNRYVVRAVDKCLSKLELRFETSSDESFVIRFHSEDECKTWFSALRLALRSQGLRWQGITCSSAQQLPLASPFHCSALIESSSHVIACVGGDSGSIEIYELSLLGLHAVAALPVDPFHEGPGVKVKPGRRSMAAMALIEGSMYIFGGTPLAGLPSAAERSLPIFRDMWKVRLQQDSGAVLQWERVLGHEQPHDVFGVAGHSIISVPMKNGSSGLVTIGGFGSDGTAVRRCQVFDVSACTVEDFPSLDTLRGLHGTAHFADGSVVLIGGLPSISASDRPLSSASFYSPTKQQWSPLKCSQPLPGMVNPCVCVLGVEMLVFGGSGKAGTLPQLFSMVVVGDTLVVKLLDCLGDTPVTQYGLSCVVDEEDRVMYVIGSTPSIATAPHLHRVLLP